MDENILLQRITVDPKIDVFRQPSIIVRFLVMNTRYEPLSHVKVRQAINYALDKDAIIKIAWGGAGVPMDSVIPPDLQFYSAQKPWPTNLEKARALMKEAGYEDGFEVLFMAPNISQRIRVIEMTQQQLAKIGITGKIVTKDTASFYNTLETHKADDPNTPPFIAFSAWSASTGDADWGIRPLLATESSSPNGSNAGFYSDSKIDELITAGLSSADPEVRRKVYAELQDYVWEQAPWAYLFVDTMLVAKSNKVKGIFPLPDGAFSVEEAELLD